MLSDRFELEHIKCGRDKMFTLMGEHNLLVPRRRAPHKTTNSNHNFKKYPNIFKDEIVDRPNQVWASDITYIRTYDGFAYLSLITDVFSRKIVGYFLSRSLSRLGPIQALKNALKAEHPKDGLLHHSDRGLQYCSRDYVETLGPHHRISMTENGDPYENALAERVNGILKDEYCLSETFISFKDALAQIKDSINIYNTRRPHLSCGMQTPEQTHSMGTHPGPLWVNYYKKAG